MRRSAFLALALAALLAPPAGAGTTVWVETFAAEPGTMTHVDSIATGTVVSVIGGGTVVVSKDYGTTWAPLGPLSHPPAGGSSQTRVAVSSPTRWFAENGRAVSGTTDGGATWRDLAVPPVVRPARESFEFATEVGAADGLPYAVVGWAGARIRGLCPYALDFTPLFVTRDGGAHWRRVDLPGAGDVDRVTWFDARHAVATVVEREWSEPASDDDGCSSTGRWTANSVWTTSDSGTTWRLALRTTEWYVTAAWATTSSVVVLGETKGVGRAYVSLDGGRRFSRPIGVYAVPGQFNGFPSMEFVAGRRGYLGAILAGIYRTDNGGTEWAHEVSPADGGFYGVPEITVMNRDRAVFGGPSALLTRYTEVAAVPAGAPGVAVPSGSVVTTAVGAATATLTRPAYGPSTLTLHVARDA